MIQVSTLTPAEILPPEAERENAFLYEAEAKPLPDPPEPKDDEAQEIAVEAGTDNEVRLIFNIKDPDLVDRVAGVCNSYYVNAGMPGIKALYRAITEQGFLTAPGTVPVRVPKKDVPEVKGEQTYANPDDSPKREALRAALGKWKTKIEPFIRKALARVETVARDVATKKLEGSAKQTLGEAVRYLRSGSLGGTTTTTPSLVLPGSPLTGPDVVDLITAIVEIATLLRELELFRSEVEDKKRELRGVGITDQPAGIFGPKLLRAAQAKDLRSLLESPTGIGALGRATQGFEAASRLLAQECSRLCRQHPVLYRLWDQPVIFEIAELWNRTPAAQQLAAVQAQGTLAQALTTTLNKTSAAANEFIADLRSNPDEVWRYDNAIYAALKALHLGQGDVAWRAAEDKLEETHGSMSPIAKIGMGLGATEMIAAGLAVAPPVAAVLAILSGAVGIAGVVEDAANEARKDRAFLACLDPSQSLALEPGSYTGVVIGALFMMFQLKSLGKPLRAAVLVP